MKDIKNFKFIGHQSKDELPVKAGDTVIVLKGTPFKSTHPTNKIGVTKRQVKVRVDHMLSGMDLSEGDLAYERRHGRHLNDLPAVEREICGQNQVRYPVHNPSIVWAGSGGYWMEVDINLVEKISSEGV